MIYEIVNPSDPYTFEHHDFRVAAVALLLLGEGRYAGTPKDGGPEIPMFLFGGTEEWLKAQDINIEQFICQRRADIADALDSVIIGSFRDRVEVLDALSRMPSDQHDEYLEQRHDRRRTSMNDIGERAKMLARMLRRGANLQKSESPLPWMRAERDRLVISDANGKDVAEFYNPDDLEYALRCMRPKCMCGGNLVQDGGCSWCDTCGCYMPADLQKSESPLPWMRAERDRLVISDANGKDVAEFYNPDDLEYALRCVNGQAEEKN